MRKLVGALVIAAFLGAAAVPAQTTSTATVSCKRPKKAKLIRPGKYKVTKFKVKKAGKRHKYTVKPSAVASPKPTSRPAPDPGPGTASE